MVMLPLQSSEEESMTLNGKTVEHQQSTVSDQTTTTASTTTNDWSQFWEELDDDLPVQPPLQKTEPFLSSKLELLQQQQQQQTCHIESLPSCSSFSRLHKVSSCYFSVHSVDSCGSTSGVSGTNNTAESCLFPDIVFRIFSYLRIDELAAFSETSKEFNSQVSLYLQLKVQHAVLADSSSADQEEAKEEAKEAVETEDPVETTITPLSCLARLRRVNPEAAHELVQEFLLQQNSALNRSTAAGSASGNGSPMVALKHLLQSSSRRQRAAGAALFLTTTALIGSAVFGAVGATDVLMQEFTTVLETAAIAGAAAAAVPSAAAAASSSPELLVATMMGLLGGLGAARRRMKQTDTSNSDSRRNYNDVDNNNLQLEQAQQQSSNDDHGNYPLLGLHETGAISETGSATAAHGQEEHQLQQHEDDHEGFLPAAFHAFLRRQQEAAYEAVSAARGAGEVRQIPSSTTTLPDPVIMRPIREDEEEEEEENDAEETKHEDDIFLGGFAPHSTRPDNADENESIATEPSLFQDTTAYQQEDWFLLPQHHDTYLPFGIIHPTGCVGHLNRLLHDTRVVLGNHIKQERQRGFKALSQDRQRQSATSFIDACCDNNLDVVKELLPAMDVEAFHIGPDGTETCALHAAAFHGANDVLNFLCRDVRERQNNDGECTKENAEHDNSSSQYDDKVDGGLCNINIQDSNGWTALHFAVGANLVEAVQILCKFGANFDLEAANGYTPLQWAGRLQHESVAQALRTIRLAKATAAAERAKQKASCVSVSSLIGGRGGGAASAAGMDGRYYHYYHYYYNHLPHRFHTAQPPSLSEIVDRFLAMIPTRT